MYVLYKSQTATKVCNSRLEIDNVLEEIIMIISQTAYNTTYLQFRCTKLTFRQLAAVLILDCKRTKNTNGTLYNQFTTL